MKYMLTCGVFIVLLSLPLADASAEGVSSVVGVEAGYGYLFSSKGMDPQSPHALLTNLYYGYLVVDRPNTSALLSIVLGYDWFPTAAGGSAVHAIDYGLGPVFNMSAADQIMVNIAYNFMDFPYFDQASGRLSYGSLAVRYLRRL